MKHIFSPLWFIEFFVTSELFTIERFIRVIIGKGVSR